MFDGMAARRLRIQSRFGASFDRLRDKFFACSIFIYFLTELYCWNCGQAWHLLIRGLIILFLLIELILLLSWIYSLIKRIDISSHMLGKIKMAFYFLAIAIWFLVKWMQETYHQDFRILICYGVMMLMFFALVYGIQSLGNCLQVFYQETQNRD